MEKIKALLRTNAAKIVTLVATDPREPAARKALQKQSS